MGKIPNQFFRGDSQTKKIREPVNERAGGTS
jgi:hypothetical protein